MFVKVSNPANPALFFEEEFHVEPTAVCSFVPEWRLEKIEIRPLKVREIIQWAAGTATGRRRAFNRVVYAGTAHLSPHFLGAEFVIRPQGNGF